MTPLAEIPHPGGTFVDLPGFCTVATVDEIEKQGWSLNPRRSVGVAVGNEEDFDFAKRLDELNDELPMDVAAILERGLP